MKYRIFKVCSAQVRQLLIVGSLLFILGGCEKTPDAAKGDTVQKSRDDEPASSNGGATSRATEQDHAAPETASPKVVVDVSAFREYALEGKLESVQKAIEAGVDVNSADEEQRTALLFAAFNGHTPVVKLLLDSGARLEQRDSMGRTALMFASTGDNAATVNLLLESGADVNTVDTNEGFTPLMYAAAEGHVDVVKALLQHDADPSLRDTDGDSARDFAQRNGHTRVVRLLQQ